MDIHDVNQIIKLVKRYLVLFEYMHILRVRVSEKKRKSEI